VRPFVAHPAAQKPSPRPVRVLANKSDEKIEYGANWYERTRGKDGSVTRGMTTKEYLQRYREANERDRPDLYSANWRGDTYTGSNINILTVIAAISILAPLLGLWVAFSTYGDLWG